MLQIMINFYMFLMSIIFLIMSHPLTMGITLLIQTFLISLMTGLIHQSYWFSYVLFLIFVGGMLILFLYMTSISSNEKFSISHKLFIFPLILFLLIFMILILSDFQYFNLMKNLETLKFEPYLLMNKENTLNLKKMYNFPTNTLTLFLIIYLFITMVISVKITNFFYGPLRPLFN